MGLFSSHYSTCWKPLQKQETPPKTGIFLTLKPWSPYRTYMARGGVGAVSCYSKCLPADVHPILLWPCSHLLSTYFLVMSKWRRVKAWPHVALPSHLMESLFHPCYQWQRLNVRAACTSFHRNQFSHKALILEVLLPHLIVGQAQ